jgi:hypothetical protein
MQVVQVQLSRKTSLGVESQVCWVPADKGIKKGSVVTLKDQPKVKWQVVDLYGRAEHSEIKTGRDWKQLANR